MSTEVLSEEEVDTLLDKEEQTDKISGESQEFDPYNFAELSGQETQDFSKIETVNEIFNRDAAIKLSQFLCRKVHLESGTPEIINYEEYIQSLSKPSVNFTLTATPLAGMSLISFSTDLMHRMIEVLFGGKLDSPPDTEREFGHVELRISTIMIEMIIQAFSTAWKEITPINFQQIKCITNPALINIANKFESMTVSKFELIIGETRSEFKLCLPSNMLKPINGLLHNNEDAGDEETPEQETWKKSLRENVFDIDLNLNATLSEILLRIGDIKNLKEGDIIPIKNPNNILLRAENMSVFKGKCGTCNGNHAVMIQDVLKK